MTVIIVDVYEDHSAGCGVVCVLVGWDWEEGTREFCGVGGVSEVLLCEGVADDLGWVGGVADFGVWVGYGGGYEDWTAYGEVGHDGGCWLSRTG